MTTPHARRRLLALLLGVTACLLALPAMASAATLTVTGTSYDYDSGGGIANRLTVSVSTANPFISFNDTTETITVAGPQAANCSGSGTNTVNCNAAPTVVDLSLGDLDDKLAYNATNVPSHQLTVNGGTGNESELNFGSSFIQYSTNSATQPPVTVNGDDGDDNLFVSVANNVGLGGNTNINGGNGDDLLRNGTGATMNGDANNDTFVPSNPGGGTEFTEVMNGGAGEDLADYSGFPTAVSVTVDGVANDGPIQNNGTTDNVGADNALENVRGGGGVDTITGTVAGQNNKFFGNSANDFLNGGPGDDTLDGEQGADILDGGPNGSAGDTASYATRTNEVIADNDGVADDGEVGLLVGPSTAPPNPTAERDNILATTENIAGGTANDALTGDGVANVLTGNGGDDTLDGAAGGDTLNGGGGDDDLDGAADGDTINGGSGDDTGAGGAGTDTINGDNGFDRLDGEAGTDTVNGGAGGDTIGAMDGAADTVNCGDGTDNALPDASGDTVNADCEISGSGGGGVGPAGPAGPAGPQGSKGDKGESGSNGSQGPAGPQGPSGPEGDQGAQGPRGEDVSVGCQVAPNSARTRLAVVCDVFRTGSARPVIAKLTRGSKTFGRGSSKIRNNTIRFNLKTNKLSKGRYRLTLTQKGVRLITLGVTIR